jgi:hypothetical protein
MLPKMKCRKKALQKRDVCIIGLKGEIPGMIKCIFVCVACHAYAIPPLLPDANHALINPIFIFFNRTITRTIGPYARNTRRFGRLKPYFYPEKFVWKRMLCSI